MSRDTKTSCTDCQECVGASFVPSATLFHRTKEDGSNESNAWQKSVRSVTSSVAITYTSDTDEGDYETSSEGMIPLKRSDTEIRKSQTKESLCVYFKNKSISLSKLVAFDKNISLKKEEVIPDSSHEFIANRLTREITMKNKTAHVHGSLIFVSENLAKSKSLPILKSEISSNISANFKAMDVALISESSFAREKKMSMIVRRMAPLISPIVFLTNDTSTNFHSQQYKARKDESKTMLPILCDTTPTAVINDKKSEELVAEVTFHKTKNNHRTMDWDPYRDAIPTFVNDESIDNLMNDDGDLVDVARNSYSSIKSIYFPPNPSEPPILPNDFIKPKKHQRVSADVEALLKIDYELSPLQYQYSEIIGKTRALGLSGTGFDLGISCRLDQPDTFAVSPNESNYYLLNRDQTFLRHAATSCNFENRSRLVDNTSPSPTFSVVGKSAPTGSRTSCLNDSSSYGRRKTLSYAIHDLSRAVESLNGLRSCNSVGKSASYLPATNSHASQEENILHKRSCDKCISNNNSQLHRKSNAVIKEPISGWDSWSIRERINTSSSNILCKTEYNSHRYLNRTVENSQTSGNNNIFEVRKQKSSMFIMIDDNWPVVNEETTNKRLNEHFEILPDGQNSTMVQTEFAIRNSSHKNISPETKRVVTNDRTSSPFESKLIDHCTGRDRQLSRAVSALTCDSQIGVNLKTKFCTSRAVSPIRNFLSTSPNNILLTANVSSIFVQQVHTDSTTEVVKIEPPSEIRSVEINKRKNDAAVASTRKRDFCVQKVDSQREVAEDLSRFSEFKKDQAYLMTERKKTQHLRLSKSIADTKEKITIIPIVLTDGIPESPRIADVDFAIPRYINKMVPQLNYQFVPFEARKSRRIPSPSNGDTEICQKNAMDSVCLTDELRPVNEKYWRTHGTFVSRASNLYAQEDFASSKKEAKSSKRSTRAASSSNAKVGEKMGEYCKSVAPRAIPGMRSSPEDFLCET